MLRIAAITAEADLSGLAPEWEALWRRVPDATPFQAPAWLLAWWASFGTGAPRLLIAREEKDLVGVLPLYILEERGCRKLLPIGISLSDLIDALIDPVVPGVAHALLMAIAEIEGWDACHLPGLAPGAALLAAAPPPGFCEMRHQDESCLFLPLPPVLPRKKRQNLRRAMRATAAAGEVRFALAGPDDIAAAIEDLFRLHEARWRRRGEPGVCAEPPVRHFHAAAARGLGEKGLLRLRSLALDGAVVAVLYGFLANGIGYAYLCGFDPDHAALGVGTQLLAHAIAEAAREGAYEFQFLRGGEPHKLSWGAASRPTFARNFRRRQ